MSNTPVTIPREAQAEPRRTLFEPLLASTAASSGALIFGLAGMLSWQECTMVILAAGTLAGGAVFTFLEMLRLGRE